jgi:acyl carrier protein
VSAGSSMVAPGDLTEAVRTIVGQVLMVSPADVHLESSLVGLGAESIDFLDLVFRIEEVIGKKVPVTRWEAFVNTRLPGADLSSAITLAIVVEFAEQERSRT